MSTKDKLPLITIAGVKRRFGLLLPPPGFVSAMPVFESTVTPMDDATLKRIAQSGKMDGRIRYGSRFIADQQSAGSCNGWAGATALDKSRFDRGLQRAILGGAYTYSLINGGRDGGSMLEDGMRSLMQDGACPDSIVSAMRIYPRLYDQAKASAASAKYRARECYAVETKQGFWTALALGFKVIVAVHVGSNFDRLDNSDMPGDSNGPGNHAVHCDGLSWLSNELTATAENSWGQRWGRQGRMNLAWRHFDSTFENHTFYAIRSTSDGDDGPPDVRLT